MKNTIDWGYIRLFLAIMESDNLDEAARKVRVSRSTISRQIQKFEQELGIMLFDRTSEGLKPTEIANRMYDSARHVNVGVDTFFELASGGDREVSGVVRVSSMPQFIQDVVIPKLPALTKKYPNLVVEFVDDIVTPNIARRETHISIRLTRRDFNDLIVKKVADLSYGIFASQYITIDESRPMREHPWVTYDESMSHLPDSRWLLENWGTVSTVVRAKHRTTILAAANAGLGICLSPRIFTRKYENLREIYRDHDDLPKAPLWLSCDKQYRKLPKINAVWEFLTEIASELS